LGTVDWLLTGKDSTELTQDEGKLLTKYRQLEQKDRD